MRVPVHENFITTAFYATKISNLYTKVLSDELYNPLFIINWLEEVPESNSYNKLRSLSVASVDSRKAVKQLPFAETLLVIATSKTNKPYKFKFICF